MAWVFMDLEMKPVDKQFRRQRDICRQEVIEFGAVKLGEDMAETDSFRALVKPAYGEIPPRERWRLPNHRGGQGVQARDEVEGGRSHRPRPHESREGGRSCPHRSNQDAGAHH